MNSTALKVYSVTRPSTLSPVSYSMMHRARINIFYAHILYCLSSVSNNTEPMLIADICLNCEIVIFLAEQFVAKSTRDLG